jgi:hypothetical protein
MISCLRKVAFAGGKGLELWWKDLDTRTENMGLEFAMKTFETLEHAGADKMVRLAIPVDEANRRYHLVVLVEPASDDLKPPVRAWPPGFFEATAGKWVGDLERPPQGDFEKREEL